MSDEWELRGSIALLPNEVWKDIKGYESLYQVSNMGRVKSLPRLHHPYEQILAPHEVKGGYLQAELLRDGSKKGIKIHRLVAEAFIPNPEGKREVNHIDGDKHNNAVDNLEWVTSSENQMHAFYVTKAQKMSTVLQKDLDGKPIRKWYGINRASRALGIQAADISHCCSGQRKTAGGFTWELIDPVRKDLNLC